MEKRNHVTKDNSDNSLQFWRGKTTAFGARVLADGEEVKRAGGAMILPSDRVVAEHCWRE
jgi:hypothetical protein